MPHITDKLHEEHEKIAKLFEKLQGTGDGAEKTRLNLCEEIKHNLLAHTEFEEEVFYPAVRQAGDGAGGEVSEALQEHQEVDRMLEQLEGMDPTSEDFIDLITEMQSAVEAHVRHEEDDIFPLAKKSIEASEAERMSQRYNEMAKEHMQQARP